MIKFLVKKLIKNHEDVKDNKVREKYGVLGGVLGIICNLILFAVKLIIGILVNAVAVMSDAFNNLTDSFSSIVGIISAKISNKKPDKDHPFGHQRIEYISGLIVAIIILFMTFVLVTIGSYTDVYIISKLLYFNIKSTDDINANSNIIDVSLTSRIFI